MSIYYKLTEQNDNLHSSESRKRGLYPRIIRKRTTGLEELCQFAVKGTTFSAVEMEIAVKLLVSAIMQELGDGNNVCIDNFGTFSVSAEAVRKATEQHEIRAESIRAKKIVFKTSQALLKHHSFEFKRLPKS